VFRRTRSNFHEKFGERARSSPTGLAYKAIHNALRTTLVLDQRSGKVLRVARRAQF